MEASFTDFNSKGETKETSSSASFNDFNKVSQEADFSDFSSHNEKKVTNEAMFNESFNPVQEEHKQQLEQQHDQLTPGTMQYVDRFILKPSLDTLRAANGVVEGAMTLSSGFLAGIPAGIVMLARAGNPEAIEEIQKKQEHITYKPMTQEGQLAASVFAYPFQKMGELLHLAGESVYDDTTKKLDAESEAKWKKMGITPTSKEKIDQQIQNRMNAGVSAAAFEGLANLGTMMIGGEGAASIAEGKASVAALQARIRAIGDTTLDLKVPDVVKHVPDAPHELRAAFKMNDGTINSAEPGEGHPRLSTRHDIRNVSEEGFTDSNNNFYNREQAGLKFGGSTSEQLGIVKEYNGPAIQGGAVEMPETFGKFAEATRDFLKASETILKVTSNLEDDLHSLTNRQQTYDVMLEKFHEQILNIYGKEEPAYQSLEKVYHYDDEVKTLGSSEIKLSQKEQGLYDYVIAPIGKAFRDNLQSLKGDGFNVSDLAVRRALKQGSPLDRFFGGTKERLSSGNVLSTTMQSMKKRVMYSLEDENGIAVTASVKKGEVFSWDKKEPVYMGKWKNITNEQRLNTDINKVEKQSEQFNNERKILSDRVDKIKGEETATVSARAVLNDRIIDIDEKLEGLEKQKEIIKSRYNPSELQDYVFVDAQGKSWKLKQATTAQIEQDTNLKYSHNALANYTSAYLDSLRALDARNFLEKFKTSPQFYEIAMKVGTDAPIPQGWRGTHLRQFQNYYFEPGVAAVLDRFHSRYIEGSHGIPKLFTQVSNFLTTSIFFNPLLHVPNIAVQWLTEKGISGTTHPIIETRAMGRAWEALSKHNEDWFYALDNGAALMSGYGKWRDGFMVLARKTEMELTKNPAMLSITRALGYANPVQWAKAWYGMSHWVTWHSQDLLYLQSIYARMERNNLSFEQAMKTVEETIPNYRVPSQIMRGLLGDTGSEWLSKYVMNNPHLTMFGPYHYGILKAWGTMAKDASFLGKVPIEKRARAWDRMAMLALIQFVLYPIEAEVWKKVTGKENTEVRRSGMLTPAVHMYDFSQGQKDLSSLIASVVTPAVFPDEALQQFTNYDWHMKQPIRGGVHKTGSWGSGETTPMMDSLEHAAKRISPLFYEEQIRTGKKSTEETILNQFGVKFPKQKSMWENKRGH